MSEKPPAVPTSSSNAPGQASNTVAATGTSTTSSESAKTTTTSEGDRGFRAPTATAAMSGNETEMASRPPQRRAQEKTCYNCGMSGHIARDCTNPRLEGEDRQVINKARAQYRRCFNCGRIGHISADCPKPAGNKACYNCGGEGHIAKDCPNPKLKE